MFKCHDVFMSQWHARSWPCEKLRSPVNHSPKDGQHAIWNITPGLFTRLCCTADTHRQSSIKWLTAALNPSITVLCMQTVNKIVYSHNWLATSQLLPQLRSNNTLFQSKPCFSQLCFEWHNLEPCNLDFSAWTFKWLKHHIQRKTKMIFTVTII